MKKLSMSLLLIAIMILSISVVSATDADGFNDLTTAQDGTADVCAVDEEVGPIGVDNGQDIVDSSGPTKSFTDLRNAIDGAGSELVLDSDYKYNATIDTAAENAVRYVDGVFINKNLTIDGAGHTLDGSDVNRIFRVYGFTTVTLKNIKFINGKAATGSAVYSAGSLTYENCTFSDGSNVYDDASAVSSGSVYENTATTRFTVITDETSYNAALADPTSPLNRYYYAFNREDSIKEDDTPAGAGDFVAGHSWEAAIKAPTNPARTSTLPWVVINLVGISGELKVEYDGEVKLTDYIAGPYSVMMYSVPNELGMTDYRLEWSTGNPSTEILDDSKVDLKYTPYKSFTDLRTAIDNTPAEGTLVLEDNYGYNPVADIAAENAVRYVNGVFINKNLTIDGNGHVIDASTVNRAFIVYGFTTATIKNAVFINGKGDKGKAIYSAGHLTFENCTFIDDEGNRHDDSGAVSSGSVYENTATSRFIVIKDEASYNAALADPASPLNRLYYAYNREDGIDVDGNPVYDPNTFIAGHSWQSAIKAPTNPDKTSTLPWIAINLVGIRNEDLVVEYEGEAKKIEYIEGPYSVMMYSVPNELDDMEDYRLQWGTGYPGTKTLDASEVNVYSVENAGSYKDLANRINNAIANNNSILVLPYDFAYNETYDGPVFLDGVTIDRPLTIIGNNHYIDGVGKARIFNVGSYADANVSGVVFKNGVADYGGAIYAAGKLSIDNCTFTNNVATKQGNDIYITNVVASIDCEAGYDAQLSNPDSALSLYYKYNPNEDIDSNDPRGHSWDAAITAPTVDGLSTFPWVAFRVPDEFDFGRITIKYDGVVLTDQSGVYLANLENMKYFIWSVPNHLGLTEYRLNNDGSRPVDSQGNEIVFDMSKFEVIFEPAFVDPGNVSVIVDEVSYDALLNDPDSALNKYYQTYPYEDVDSNDPRGHSWSAAISSPTYLGQTSGSSKFPWIVLNMDKFTGSILVVYDGIYRFYWPNRVDKDFGIISVPAAEDCNMPDYALEFGTGNVLDKTFDPSLLQVFYYGSSNSMSMETFARTGTDGVTIKNSIFTDAGNGYSIYNLGDLGLENNTLSNIIFNGNKITSQVNSTVLGNGTYDITADTYNLNATLVDDNGNKIYDPDFRFTVNGERIDVAPDYDAALGLYNVTYTIASNERIFVVNVTSSNEDKLVTKYGILRNIKGTYTDLQNQINEVDPGMSFVMLSYDFAYNAEIDGEKFIDGVVINKSIVIFNFGNNIIIDGKNQARIFNITNNSIVMLGDDITFANGNATKGGGIYVDDGSNLIANKLEFINNTATDTAGAIYADGDVTISNSLFVNNTASGVNGIYVSGNGIVTTITGCDFTDDKFIYNEGGLVFENNKELTAKADDSYSVYNAGNLTLDANQLNTTIYNIGGEILSDVNVTLLDNTTVTTEIGQVVQLNATMVDDSGNAIYDSSFKFIVGENITDSTYNNLTRLYGAEYTTSAAGTFIANVTNIKAGKLNTKIGIIEVLKINTTLTVSVENIGYGENATISVTLVDYKGNNLNGTVTVVINNKPYNITVDNGQGSINNVSGLAAKDNYLADATFNGTGTYANSSATDLFNVTKAVPVINVTAADVTYPEDVVVTVTSDTSGDVVVTVGGQSKPVTLVAGVAQNVTFSGLNANETGYSIVAKMNETENYTAAFNDTETVKVMKATITITLGTEGELVVGNEYNVTFVLPADVDGQINVTLESIYTQYYGKYGNKYVVPEFGSNPGDFTYAVNLTKDTNYNDAYGSLVVHISKIDTPIEVNVTSPNEGENATVTVTVPKDAGGNVTVSLANGTNYTGTVDENGTATISIPNLPTGDNDVNITYAPGNNDYAPKTANATIHVKKVFIVASDMKRGWNSPYDYQVKLVDEDGNPVGGKTIVFTIKGKQYNATTGDDGIANLTTSKLAVGTYDVTITNPANGENTTKKLTIVARLIENKDVVRDYDDDNNKAFTVRAIGDDGNPVGAGVVVDITINGVTYHIKTDKNGIATRTIGLVPPKTYPITATYQGYTVKNKVVVKQVLFVKSVTVKKTAKSFVLQATLKHSNGKVIPNKVITFTFLGKNYKVKTNSKGIAKVTLGKAVINKLRKGRTYAFKAMYAKNNVAGKDVVKGNVIVK